MSEGEMNFQFGTANDTTRTMCARMGCYADRYAIIRYRGDKYVVCRRHRD
jgi:hypothetical protein